jgi:hypothetical protein
MGVDHTFLTIRNIIRDDRVIYLNMEPTAQEMSLLPDGRLLEPTDNVPPAELEQGVLSTTGRDSNGEGDKMTAAKEATRGVILAPGLCGAVGSRLRSVGRGPKFGHTKEASDVSQIAKG